MADVKAAWKREDRGKEHYPQPVEAGVIIEELHLF